ncbi:MAG: TlpA disulfide reductase family protein [Polyangiales bacterium]
MSPGQVAPPLVVAQWFNSPAPIELASLRGRVVLIYAFQMLCPGCVQFTIPQAKEVHAEFDSERLVVLGLHTVFEDHDRMTPQALEEFIAENQLRFPIGVDMPDARLPKTMKAYDMQGTPTVVIIDAEGRRRVQHFGHVTDLQLSATLNALIAEAARARKGEREP